jgi:hypothetical protein
MHTAKMAIVSTALTLGAFSASAATVTPAEAMGQVGHTAKVCGIVASAVFEANSSGHPTFLTLVNPKQPNVNRGLTGVIYGSDRAKFGSPPEVALQGKLVCMTGFVSFFRERPEMILSDPRQVSYSVPPSVAQLR